MIIRLRTIAFACLLYCCGVVRGHADVPVLDFRQGDNLKLVFDGGLRPTHVPMLEKMKVDIGRTNLRFILPTGESFEAPVQDGSFTVLEGNVLSTAEFTVITQSIPKTVALVERICKATGLPTEKGLWGGSLQAAAARAGTWVNPAGTEDRVWNQSRKSGGLDFTVTYDSLYRFTHTAAYARLDFDWHKPSKAIRFSRAPIQPPPGYEHLSLAPGQGRQPPVPFKTAEEARAAINKSIADSPPGQVGNAGKAAELAQTDQPFWRRLLILVVGVAIAVGCWIIVRKRKRREVS
ncbi:hypothetical protein ACXR0O_17960 [Verrucomicrobiota bacterium sgz303538]